MNFQDAWGLKAVDPKTPEDCAKEWAEKYLNESMENDQEYGSTIYKTTDEKGNTVYKYTEPNIGSAHGCSPSWPENKDDVVMYIHTHGAESGPEYKDEEFSTSDKNYATNNKIDGFVVTPSGAGKKYDYETGEVDEYFDLLPDVDPVP